MKVGWLYINRKRLGSGIWRIFKRKEGKMWKKGTVGNYISIRKVKRGVMCTLWDVDT